MSKRHAIRTDRAPLGREMKKPEMTMIAPEMKPMIAPKMMTSRESLDRISASTDEHASPYLSSTYNQNEEIRAITDKISKALDTFEGLYAETEEKDSLLHDVVDQVDMLEGGRLKVQLKQFINQYKEFSEKIKVVEEERAETFQSLESWCDAEHLIDVDMADYGEEVDTEFVKDTLAKTKMGFSQLKQLKEDITNNEAIGRDNNELMMEKQNLEQKIMQNVKTYQKATSEKSRPSFSVSDSAKAFQHASGEICGLLKRTREEGIEQREMLITKVENLTKMMKRETEARMNSEKRVKELEYMEKQWKEENRNVMRDKTHLEFKMKHLKKMLTQTRQKLSRYEAVSKTRIDGGIEEGESEEEEMNSVINDSVHYDMSSNSPVDPTKLKIQLKLKGEEIAALSTKTTQLTSTIEELEQALKDKEVLVDSLEADKCELLHQMKQNSLRPDTRHLSNISQESARTSSVTGVKPSVRRSSLTSTPSSLSGLSFRSSSIQLDSGRCANCHCHRQQSLPAKSSTAPAKHHSDKALAASLESISSSSSSSDDPKLHSECKRKLTELKAKLFDAQDEIAYLQLTCERVQADARKKVARMSKQRKSLVGQTIKDKSEVAPTAETAEKESAAENTEPPSKEQQAPSVMSHCDILISEVAPTAETAEKESAAENTEPPSKEEMHDQPPEVLNTEEREAEECIYVTRGMQTDPTLDPIGAWSKGAERQQGWKPPLPPATWVDYDPNKGDEIRNMEDDTIGESMLHGVDPLEVRNVGDHVTQFVQRELERMFQGILGFVEYTHSVVDRETAMMASANRQLRTHVMQTQPKDYSAEFYEQSYGGFSNDPPRAPMNTPDGLDNVDLHSFREHLVPIEQKLKQGISELAEMAIRQLTKALELISTALKEEQSQYEELYTTIRRRTGGNVFPVIPPNEKKVELERKRSKSHSDLIAMLSMANKDEEVRGVALKPRKSQSQTSIKPASYVLKIGLEEPDRAPNAVSGWRPKNVLPTCTVPKKGQISLVTAKKVKDSQDFFIGSQALSKKKTKPVPLSHQRVQEKQRELRKRIRDTDRRGQERGVINTIEVDPSLLCDDVEKELFTVKDFEKEVEAYEENIKDPAGREWRQSVLTSIDNDIFPSIASPDHQPGSGIRRDSILGTTISKRRQSTLERSSLPPLASQ